MGGEDVKELYRVMDSCGCVARETSGLAYSWKCWEDGYSRRRE